MEKKSILKRIKDYFSRMKRTQKFILSTMDGMRKGLGVDPIIPEEQPIMQVVYQTTMVEPDIMVYSEEEMELKYVAIDKLFAMQERFSKVEFCWIKEMVTDERFLRTYFEGTNEALIDYLESLYKAGKFTTNMMDAMTSLGMVVMSFADRMRFVDTEAIIREFKFVPTDFSKIEHSMERSPKKNS